MRIYELASELGISKKDLVAKVRTLGFPINNFMSVVDPDSISRIRSCVERERQASIEKVQVNRSVFRRRRKDRRPLEGEHHDPLTPELQQLASDFAVSSSTGEDAAERFKLALEESLRQHLERSQTAAQGEPPPPILSSTPRRQVAVQRNKVQAFHVEEPILTASDSSLGVAAAASQTRLEDPAPDDGHEVAAPHLPRFEPVSASGAKAAEAVVANEQQPSAQERQDRVDLARNLPRPGPRVARPSERSSPAQGAVVVAIPDQQERDRRLGLIQQGQRRGKKGKTTITRQDLYRSSKGFGGGRRAGKKKVAKRGAGSRTAITTPSEHKRLIRIDESITVSDLAQRMGLKAGELIRSLLEMGLMVSITQSLDVDTATLVATEFGYDIKNVAFQETQVLEDIDDDEEDLVLRAPVVTMMGHVDHGKTSLLDKIRQTRVAEREAGGITQHIGAYDVVLGEGSRIVFLDTPGHEAFTAMRARGAQATDIVVLVVAANDGVMPQTIEAINHSKDAGVPIIVAINKVDMPGTNPDRIRQALAEHSLLPDDWGGDTIMVNVSARTGEGIEDLLEGIRLHAELMELKANPKRRGRGVVLEARLETGRGAVATILVQNGSVEVGDVVVAGICYGKVRAMADDLGGRVKQAGPATPVEVVGLNEVPTAGDPIHVVTDEKSARSLVEHRAGQQRRTTTMPSIAGLDLAALLGAKTIKDLKVIIKADVRGSVEAVREALQKLSTDEVKLSVIHEGVGGVRESDVMLASATIGKSEGTEMLVLAFNLRPQPRVLDLAASHGVNIKTYTVIYDAVDDVKAMMSGMLAPTTREKYLGRAEVRETFSIPKVGTIAGCKVQDGRIRRGTRVRLLRSEIIVWEGRLASLKRFKDDVREVNQGFECGIGLESFNDIHLQDIIEAYEMEEVAAEI